MGDRKDRPTKKFHFFQKSFFIVKNVFWEKSFFLLFSKKKVFFLEQKKFFAVS